MHVRVCISYNVLRHLRSWQRKIYKLQEERLSGAWVNFGAEVFNLHLKCAAFCAAAVAINEPLTNVFETPLISPLCYSCRLGQSPWQPDAESERAQRRALHQRVPHTRVSRPRSGCEAALEIAERRNNTRAQRAHTHRANGARWVRQQPTASNQLSQGPAPQQAEQINKINCNVLHALKVQFPSIFVFNLLWALWAKLSYNIMNAVNVYPANRIVTPLDILELTKRACGLLQLSWGKMY